MAWQEPLTINRAPGDLETIRGYINTNNIEHERDLLLSPDQLQEWLSARGLLRKEEEVSRADFERGIVFRDALHRLVLANNKRPLDQSALDTLNRVTTDSCLLVRVQPDGSTRLEAGSGGVDGAFAMMMGIIYTAMVEGTWHRLKGCKNDHCQWAFYDPSKNLSGAWCSMKICGSRTKSRMYRRRAAGRTTDG